MTAINQSFMRARYRVVSDSDHELSLDQGATRFHATLSAAAEQLARVPGGRVVGVGAFGAARDLDAVERRLLDRELAKLVQA